MRTVAHHLVGRKIVQFKDLLDVIRAGEVTVSTAVERAQDMELRVVTSPNDYVEFKGDGPTILDVKNRGKLRLYKPPFESGFLSVQYYDYGEYLWHVVERPNAIVAVPLLDDDRIVLARMYRPAIGEVLHELPAGMMNGKEFAHDTALRELEEETGYTAGSVSRLWSAFSSPGFCTEEAHFYLCTDLQPGEQKLDPQEQIEPYIGTIQVAFDMIRSGAIRDMKTIAAINYLQATKDERCRSLSPPTVLSAT